MIVAIPMLLLFIFLITGMPVAFSMALSGAIGLILVGGLDLLLGVATSTPYENAAVFLFTTIPMFILMAEFLSASMMTKDLFTASNKWLGHLPGGLGMATVLAGSGLAAVSGSSTAAAATLATSAVPEMEKYGYKKHFALGVASISGTLAVMIPPSIALILYGIMTDTGIASLLIAGVIPGILTALGYIVTIYVWAKKKPEVAPKSAEKPPLKERVSSLKTVWPVLLLILAVIGGIYGGVVTPTEAGALGAFVTFVIALSLRRISFKDTQGAVKRTLKSTAMIMTIIIGAMFFGYYLTSTQMTQELINLIIDLGISKWLVLVIIMVVYIILGVFMDQAAILILTLPITFPLMMSLGFDPIWFGILVTKTVEIGLVTPPVGLNVFVAAGASGIKTEEGFKGVAPFLICDLIILIILMLFPFISTWLPSMMLQ